MVIWLKRLAIAAVFGFPAALLGFRLDVFHFGVSFQIMMVTFLVALAVFFVSMLISLIKRSSNPEPAKTARTASYIALIPIIGLGTQVVTGRSVPEIHNISTDTVNPPNFVKVVALRGENSNPLEYDASELAAVQVAAYPNIKTLIVDKTPSDIFTQALVVVKELGWELVNQDANAGIIEATETTTLWGFKDDIVIRIRLKDGNTAVDLRSVSRIGRSDLGTNAQRIQRFIDALKQ